MSPQPNDSKIIALQGTWAGVVHQEQGPDDLPLDILAELDFTDDAEGPMVKGWFTTELRGSTLRMPVSGRGRFIHPGILKMEFEVILDGIVQEPTAILEVNPDARGMRGRYVSYGARTASVVQGTVHLERMGG